MPAKSVPGIDENLYNQNTSPTAPIRIVKRFEESLFWYQNFMGASVGASDLDKGWAIIKLGSSTVILLSQGRKHENIPAGTAVSAAVRAIEGLQSWAE